MSALIGDILGLLCCASPSDGQHAHIQDKSAPSYASSSTLNEKQAYITPNKLNVDDLDMRAYSAIKALVDGDSSSLKSINVQLSKDAVRATSWASSLAESILNHLIEALQPGSPIGDALRETYDRVRKYALESFEYLEQHPEVLCALIALGILALIAPWVISALGFAGEGIVEGRFPTLHVAMRGANLT